MCTDVVVVVVVVVVWIGRGEQFASPVALSSCKPYSPLVRYGGRGSPAIAALAILYMLHAELTSRFHNVLQVVHLTRPWHVTFPFALLHGRGLRTLRKVSTTALLDWHFEHFLLV